MKKTFLLVLMAGTFLFLTATDVNIFGGFGISIMNFDPKLDPDEDELKAKISFGIGGSVDIPLGIIIIEPGLRFLSGGYQEEREESTGSGSWSYTISTEENLTLNYLNFFAKAKLSFGSLMPYVGFGMPILMSANMDYKENINGNKTSQSTDVKDRLTSTNFNIMFGVDFALPANLFISAEYSRFLNNLNDTQFKQTISFNNFMAHLGYKFSL